MEKKKKFDQYDVLLPNLNFASGQFAQFTPLSLKSNFNIYISQTIILNIITITTIIIVYVLETDNNIHTTYLRTM